MPLLNYTTETEADKTAMEISRILSSHGAKAVLTEYDEQEGTITAISFRINVNGNDIAFRLPSDWRPVLKVLERQKVRNSRIQANKNQAVRTAWRIVKVWIEAQMALIETQMVTTEQVFLPYLVTKNGQTLYEKVVNENFLLGSGN